MPLAMATTVEKEVDVSTAEYAEEDMGEEADEAEEDTDEEVVEEVAAHMKMGSKFQISPVTLRIKSGTHYQTIQESF